MHTILIIIDDKVYEGEWDLIKIVGASLRQFDRVVIVTVVGKLRDYALSSLNSPGVARNPEENVRNVRKSRLARRASKMIARDTGLFSVRCGRGPACRERLNIS